MNIEQQIKQFQPSCEQEEKDKQIILQYMKQNENVFDRENEMAHMTASAWVTNKSRDKILMVYHNIYNSWSWLGGHADGERDLLSVAIREVKEESGLLNVSPIVEDIFSLEVLTVDGHEKKGRYVSSHLHFNVTYLLEADDTETLSIKPDENSGVAWFGLERAIAASSEPWFRERVYKKLNKKLEKLSRQLHESQHLENERQHFEQEGKETSQSKNGTSQSKSGISQSKNETSQLEEKQKQSILRGEAVPSSEGTKHASLQQKSPLMEQNEQAPLQEGDLQKEKNEQAPLQEGDLQKKKNEQTDQTVCLSESEATKMSQTQEKQIAEKEEKEDGYILFGMERVLKKDIKSYGISTETIRNFVKLYEQPTDETKRKKLFSGKYGWFGKKEKIDISAEEYFERSKKIARIYGYSVPTKTILTKEGRTMMYCRKAGKLSLEEDFISNPVECLFVELEDGVTKKFFADRVSFDLQEKLKELDDALL